MKAAKHIRNFDSNSEDEKLDLFIAAMHRLRVPSNQSKEEAWRMLIEKIEERASSPAIKSHSLAKIISLAAAMVGLLMATWFFLSSGERKITTGYGEMATVYLPDSSVVILNSGTTIWYSPKNWKNQRLVRLQGEAFFKVKHGQQFSVVSSNTITSVLGTTFNIYARDTEVRVTCLTGKVLVRSRVSGKETLLLPGLRASVNKSGNLVAGRAIAENTVKWVEGKFYFQQEGVGNVFNEIERQFNVRIVYTGSRTRTYTGFFTNSSLTEALNLVCIPMKLRYELIDSSTVKISSSN